MPGIRLAQPADSWVASRATRAHLQREGRSCHPQCQHWCKNHPWVKGTASLLREWIHRTLLPASLLRGWILQLRYHVRMHRQARQEQDRFQTECQEDTMKELTHQHHQGQVEELNISRRSCTLRRLRPALLKGTTWRTLRQGSVQWNPVLCRNPRQPELGHRARGRELKNHYQTLQNMLLQPQSWRIRWA